MSSNKSIITFPFQVPIDCFEEPWVLFRGKDGKPGCVKNTCAHRACPLDLGTVKDGRIACPYHGECNLKKINLCMLMTNIPVFAKETICNHYKNH